MVKLGFSFVLKRNISEYENDKMLASHKPLVLQVSWIVMIFSWSLKSKVFLEEPRLPTKFLALSNHVRNLVFALGKDSPAHKHQILFKPYQSKKRRNITARAFFCYLISSTV